MFDRQPAGGDKSTAAAAPKDFVRTHAADQKMDRFLVTKNAGTAAAASCEVALGEDNVNQDNEEDHVGVKTCEKTSTSRTLCQKRVK